MAFPYSESVKYPSNETRFATDISVLLNRIANKLDKISMTLEEMRDVFDLVDFIRTHEVKDGNRPNH